MIDKKFLEFSLLLLYKNRSKHLGIFFISILLFSILMVVLFITSSLKNDALTTLSGEANIVVQKMRGGRVVDIPAFWIDEFLELNGVSGAQGRVYGKYIDRVSGESFIIVGIDLFDEGSSKLLDTTLENIDIKSFMKKPSMVVGESVARFLNKFYYKDSFYFFTPQKERVEVAIAGILPKNTSVISKDMMIMPNDIAKKVLGMESEVFTDIVLKVPNPLEYDAIKLDVIMKHFDVRVINKDEIAIEVENMYNYRSGLFIVIYSIALVTFLLILYQRYSMVNSSDKKEIGILRSVGWSIKDLLLLKTIESFYIITLAFLVAFLLSYSFVFFGDAPFVLELFINSDGLITLTPHFDFGFISTIFLFVVIPFISAVLIPVWRLSVVDPSEVMR